MLPSGLCSLSLVWRPLAWAEFEARHCSADCLDRLCSLSCLTGPWEKITEGKHSKVECSLLPLGSVSCASGQATAALGKGSVGAHCLMHKGLLPVSFLL